MILRVFMHFCFRNFSHSLKKTIEKIKNVSNFNLGTIFYRKVRSSLKVNGFSLNEKAFIDKMRKHIIVNQYVCFFNRNLKMT